MLAEELMLLKSGSLDIARPLNRLGKSNEVLSYRHGFK